MKKSAEQKRIKAIEEFKQMVFTDAMILFNKLRELEDDLVKEKIK